MPQSGGSLFRRQQRQPASESPAVGGDGDVFLGVEKKIEVFDEYLSEHNIDPQQVLFMGDDIPDYEIMRKAGVATCHADAAEEIKSLAAYISHHNGGHGCVRDVIEQVLKVQGNWMNEDAYHW